MQGDAAGHASGILDHGGMIAGQDGSAVGGDGDLLTQDEITPVAHEGIKTPSRGVEKRVGFPDVFKSLGTREMLDRETLQHRLLLCLYGLGTNTGLKRMEANTISPTGNS